MDRESTPKIHDQSPARVHPAKERLLQDEKMKATTLTTHSRRLKLRSLMLRLLSNPTHRKNLLILSVTFHLVLKSRISKVHWIVCTTRSVWNKLVPPPC